MSIISFPIAIDDLQGALALYDRIEVWRSPDQSGSPTAYVEITSDDEPAPAKIDGTVAGTWNLNGKTLTVSDSGADPITITFTGTDPFDLATVLTKINAVVTGLASEVPSGTNKIRLSSALTGTGSSLLLSGSACSVLGLSTSKVNGTSSRLVLADPIESYLFRDFDGSAALWYKWRLFSTVTGAASAFSAPQQGGPQPALSSTHLSTGTATLIDGSGQPVVGRRLIFVPVGSLVVNDTGVNYGSFPSVDRIVATTDDKGSISVNLLRGQTFKVFFEGTTYQREFVVPNATSFDLLTVLSTLPDPLSIVQAPPSPIRIS